MGGTLCSLIAIRQIPLRPLSEDTFVRIVHFSFSKLSRIRLKLCEMFRSVEWQLPRGMQRTAVPPSSLSKILKDWAITLLRNVDDFSGQHGVPSQKTWIVINSVRASDLSLAVDIPLWQVLNAILLGTSESPFSFDCIYFYTFNQEHISVSGSVSGLSQNLKLWKYMNK
jgi:hypothetical protein